MRHVKLFESFDMEYVGIHCSPKSLDNDKFYGKIVDDYYMAFPQVLELIQSEYPDAKTYLSKIAGLNSQFPEFSAASIISHIESGLSMEDDSADLIYEITEFFSKNSIEWIFVSTGEALTKYGSNCYDVYFEDLSKIYSMDDELTDGAKIYIYDSDSNAPILKRRDYD